MKVEDIGLPKTIKILHRDFDVKSYNHLEMMNDHDGVLGRFKKIKGEISFLRMASGSEMADTIIHECLHGIWNYFDLGNKDDEEHVVSTLATGLTTLMLDNPLLFEKLADMVRTTYEIPD